MPTYICEFEFVNEDDMITVWPFWPGRVDGTQGEDYGDAVEMAVDWFETTVLDYLARGEEIPRLPLGNHPSRGGSVVTIAIKASLDDVPAVSAAEAAALLGVSRARVTQLCKAGLLDSWTKGRARMVSCESIQLRLAEERRAGRPHVALAAG